MRWGPFFRDTLITTLTAAAVVTFYLWQHRPTPIQPIPDSPALARVLPEVDIDTTSLSAAIQSIEKSTGIKIDVSGDPYAAWVWDRGGYQLALHQPIVRFSNISTRQTIRIIISRFANYDRPEEFTVLADANSIQLRFEGRIYDSGSSIDDNYIPVPKSRLIVEPHLYELSWIIESEKNWHLANGVADREINLLPSTRPTFSAIFQQQWSNASKPRGGLFGGPRTPLNNRSFDEITSLLIELHGGSGYDYKSYGDYLFARCSEAWHQRNLRLIEFLKFIQSSNNERGQ